MLHRRRHHAQRAGLYCDGKQISVGKSIIPAHNQCYLGTSIAFDGPRYYGIHLSDNIAKTPEGFRICRNAVIGRSGFQKYRISEITDPDGLLKDFQPTDEIDVWRDPAQVFSAATLASFEGKDFTLLHPDELVTPETYREHAMGHLQNVRKGSEPLEDGNWPMLADIIVKHHEAISAIDAGARELSCGYGYILKRDGQLIQQTEIVGNHVALVPKGRAGAEARINDAAPKERKVKVTLKSLLAHGFKAFAQDATPEQLAEAVEVMGTPATAVTPPKTKAIGQLADGTKIYALDCDGNPTEPNPAMDQKAKDRKAAHDALDSWLNAEEEKEKSAQEHGDSAMDKFTKMLAGGGKDEEEHPEGCDCKDCMAAEDGEMIEAGDETTGEPVIPAGERQESQMDALIAVLKPVIAASKDAKVKKAFDSATKALAQRTAKATPGNRGSYGGFRSAAQRVAVDSTGKFAESAAQKQAREYDEMFAKDMKDRTEAYVGRR